jgi:hypothetical protein
MTNSKKSTPSDKTFTRQAILDLAAAIKNVFKKYNRQTREKAWKKLISPQGQEDVDKLIKNLNKPLSMFRRLQFAEWLDQQIKKE